ncbi:MAG: c-type cytochrome [Telluria sp.]
MMDKNRKRPPDVDEAFDPWEQVRPIPLFLVAVVFALSFWGLLTYVSEYRAGVRAASDGKGQLREARASTGASKRMEQAVLEPMASAAAGGLGNAPAAILQIVAAGKGAAWSCASCHGEAGQGSLSTPRLAGLQQGYLAKQLRDFASGARSHESMATVARALDATEIDGLAAYYAQVGLASANTPTLGGDLARGRRLAEQGDWKTDVPACFSCHGMSGEGVAPGFPALAGQHPDYIFAQLTAWKAGERANSPQALMDDIARRMAVEDMRAVADYLGSLPMIQAKQNKGT